ncbi:hypothetical protein [Streptomyces sp. Ac-502]|uniref:hypothetical protein n=1 Tax=Streptomyces sp. Ac-502 TaxID=3342801 RepID=UPI0038628525
MSVTGAPGHPYAYSCGNTVFLSEEERDGIRLNATMYVEPAKSHRAAAEDR